MGIRIEFIDLLKKTIPHLPGQEDVWLMGSMDCSFGATAANKWLAENGFPEKVPADWRKDPEPFFKCLGFRNYVDVDINDRSRVLLDLSKELPADKRHTADLVVDSGTLEHVYDTFTAIKNMNAILRPGGVIIHASPVNFFAHGYVNFNPSFFADFYKANGYEEIFLTFQVTIHNPLRIPRISPWMPVKLARFNLRPGKDWVRFLMRLSSVMPLPRNLLVVAAYKKIGDTDPIHAPTDVWE